MFERVRYGRRDPEAAVRGCAAVALLFVGAFTWLAGAVAMFGVSWILRLLRAFLAWLLADPTWGMIEPMQVVEIDAAEVSLDVEPLLYDPTDDLARLAEEAPPEVRSPPSTPLAIPDAGMVLIGSLGSMERSRMGVLAVLGGAEDNVISGDVLGVFEDSPGIMNIMGADGSALGMDGGIGGLIGARGTAIGEAGFGAGGLGSRGSDLGGTGQGLGTLGTMLPKARILSRHAVDWGELAPSLAGRLCRVGVEIRDDAFVRVDDWGACPNALRRAIGTALEQSDYTGTGVAWVVLRSPAAD